MDSEETEQTQFYNVEPAMIWGCPISDTEMKIYLNSDESVTFNRDAAQLIVDILVPWLAKS